MHLSLCRELDLTTSVSARRLRPRASHLKVTYMIIAIFVFFKYYIRLQGRHPTPLETHNSQRDGARQTEPTSLILRLGRVGGNETCRAWEANQQAGHSSP